MGLPFVLVQGTILLTDKYGNIVGTKTIGAEVDQASDPLRRVAASAAIEGVLNDVSPTVAIEGLPAHGRITPFRAHHVNLRNQSGEEIGTPENPLQVTNTYPSAFSFGDVVSSSTALQVVRRTAYNEPTTNAQRSISSSSALDTSAGTGARTVLITYYDQTGAGPFTETLTLNGVTPVNTVNTNICFIEQIEVLTAGSTGANQGTITLFNSTGGGGGAIGTIAATNNQTFWAHHYVPIGKICNISGLSCGSTSTVVGGGGLFIIRSRPIGVANAIDRQVSDFVRAYGQSSTFARIYQAPIRVTGPARLVCWVTPETSTNQTYRASMDFYEQDVI